MKRARVVRCLGAAVLGAAALTGLPALATPAAANDCVIQLGSGGITIGQGITEGLAPCGTEKGLVTASVEVPHEECNECVVRFSWDDNLGNSDIKLDAVVNP